MCITAQILLLESESLLLLHMPRTATFVPRTAHYVAEAPLFSFHVFSPVLSRVDNRRVIFGELFQSELFWRVIFMQIRLFKVMNFGSLQSQLSSNT